MRDNEAMQDSGVEWIGTIPQNWKTQQIKRRCDLLRGKFSHRPRNDPAFYNGDYPFVQTGDVTSANKFIKTYSQTLNELGLSVSKMFPRKTLVMTIAANVGDMAILDFDACFPDSLVGLVPNHHTHLDFLYYLMLAMKGVLLRSAILTTQLNLNNVQIGTIFAPFPPISEQQTIAQYLDQQCSKLDAIISIKQQQIKTLDALRQSIIYHAVTKGLDDSMPLIDSGVEWLGEIPQGWRVSKLKYITEQIVDGTHFTPNYVESGVPFLRVTDIQTDYVDLERVKYITQEEHAELTKRAKPQKGDILLSKNGTIGITKVVDWDWEFSIFVSLCLIKFLPNVSPYYFAYFFESDVVNQQLSESSKKTSVTNLHLVKIRELLLCVPPFPEQQRIIDHLDQETQRLNTLKENLSQQINTLEAYKKSLIYECVTGKKRINAEALKAG